MPSSIRRVVLLVGLLALSIPSARANPKVGNGFPCKWGSDCQSGSCSLSEHTCKGKGTGASSKSAAGASCKWGSDCASGDCSLSSHTCKGGAAPTGGGGHPRDDSASQPSEKMIIPDTTTACGEDLVAGGYYTDPVLARVNAEGTCHAYKQELIDSVKKLSKQGKGTFENVLSVVTSDPDQKRCAEEEYAKLSEADKKTLGLVMSDTCRAAGAPPPIGPRGSPAVMACAKELLDEGIIQRSEEDAQMNAEVTCENASRADLDLAKQILKELPGAPLGMVLDAVYKSTPIQIDCAKRAYKAMTPAQKKSTGFEMPATCKPKPPGTRE